MPDYVAMARDAARRAGFDPDVFVRQIRQESGFNPNARSPVGAQGIAQFMPETARGMGIDPLDPQQALNAAASWMADLKRQFGSTALALAAYNAGPGAVQKYGGIPPFEETRRYVASILGPSTAEAAELDQTSNGGSSVDTSGDRPPSEFEPPSRAAAGGTGPITRADRMRARADELRRQRAALDTRLTQLSTPGPNETPDGPLASDVAAATAARQNRVSQLRSVQRQADALDAEIRRVETDAANDPDAKSSATTTRAPSTVSTSANEPYIVTRNPDGSLKKEPNPNYVPPKPGASRAVSASANEPYIVREMPDGTIKTEPNPNYRADRPKTTTHVVGGRLVVTDENGNVVGTNDFRTPEEIAKGKLDLQKEQQDLLPKQQQILQSHIDTVKYLQGMVERGEMDPSQADAYVQLSKQATESALKGYTPFQEMSERRQAEQARQKMGIDLLNQRLATGGALANSLMGAATNNSIMLRPGQTSLGIDPLAGLGALLGELQGGADVPALARGMLMGGQTAPAGPTPAGL